MTGSPAPFLSNKIDTLRQIALKNRQIEELKTVEEFHLTRFPFNFVSFVCFRRYIYISFILSFSFLTDTIQVQSVISHVIVTHFCILTLLSIIILFCCMYKCENCCKKTNKQTNKQKTGVTKAPPRIIEYRS